MFNGFDVVVANKKLSPNVHEGASGTILMCYSNNDYEVEFMDDDGESLDVLTVPGSVLKMLIPYKR